MMKINPYYEKIAKLHKNSFGNIDLLSESSVQFIAFFYEKISSFDSTILKTIGKKELKGFILCTTERGKYFKRFLKENYYHIVLIKSIIIPLLIIVIKRYIFPNKIIKYNSELVYIAVNKKYRGQGIGKQLISIIEKEFAQRSIPSYFLQVKKSNLVAINLYKSIGFFKVQEFDRNKIKYLLMKKVIE